MEGHPETGWRASRWPELQSDREKDMSDIEKETETHLMKSKKEVFFSF